MSIDVHEIAKDSRGEGLTRRQVAERLGISTSSVRRLEYDELHPSTDANGMHRFDPEEVESLRQRMPPPRGKARQVDSPERQRAKAGRVAAAIFRMFALRKPLHEIVVRTRQPPAAVRALYHEWVTSLEAGEWERDR